MKSRIEEKLRKNLHPSFLEVKNNSHLHLGHIENDESGETHFALTIESEELKNLTLVQSHRKVKSLLKQEFEDGVHALEIKVLK